MSPKEDDSIAIAYITKPQGVTGKVSAEALTDFPERFGKVKRAIVSPPGIWLTLDYHKWVGNRLILKFQEVNSRKEAERFRGSYVKIRREELQPLPEGHYYVFQIIGLRAFTVEGKYLGKVKDVLRLSGNDVYVIEDAKGGPDILVPAVRRFITAIDLDNGRITVDPIPGLVDDGGGEVPDEI